MREGCEEEEGEEIEWRDAPEPAVRDAMATMLDLQHSRGSGEGAVDLVDARQIYSEGRMERR